jgi:hypothetical protein
MLSDKTVVDDSTEINDIRSSTHFKGISFSKYKKTEVKTAFIENLSKGKLEPACHWGAELICAGHYADLWEYILYYMAKHVHLANPRLPIYLEMRYGAFRAIMSEGHFVSELALRNNATIRRLFAEIIGTLCLSPKKHSFESLKINREEEFDMTQMPERLKAPTIYYAEPIFKKDDPKELFIAMNELAYHISPDSANMVSASYWIEWAVEFDLLCKKRKEGCKCERRGKIPVENKFQSDIIWLVWDVLQHYCEKKQSPILTKLMDALFRLFCVKYTTGACKRRRYLLYFAVALLTEPLDPRIELVSQENKVKLSAVVENVNAVYKQIKRSEESPNMEYLFSGLKLDNTFEKSIQKLEMMKSLDQYSQNTGI